MLRNYFGMHFYSFLFLPVKIKVVCFLIQGLSFVFEVHEVFKTNFMNHNQLIVYQDELIRNHLIRLVPIYCEALDNLLEDHELGLILLLFYRLLNQFFKLISLVYLLTIIKILTLEGLINLQCLQISLIKLYFILCFFINLKIILLHLVFIRLGKQCVIFIFPNHGLILMRLVYLIEFLLHSLFS